MEGLALELRSLCKLGKKEEEVTLEKECDRVLGGEVCAGISL
jgi:hypothetical protein